MAKVELEQLTKVYADGTLAVDGLDLEVRDGEFMVFVGPSGCGKTSALRMVAGLEEITGGTLRVGGKVSNDVSPKARDMAMIFQNYALYPHMSVFDNMGFALKMHHVSKEEIKRRVESAANTLGLVELLKKRPRHLSGGQRQRVAMGRAIVREPQVFLMDEPLSNLDAKLRVQMRAEIARIQHDLGVTTIYVTHDQSEAMTLGDRVCMLRGGVLQQVDRPQQLYDRPANVFVASFIGSPAMNLVEAELVEREDGLRVAFGSHELEAPASVTHAAPRLRDYRGKRVAVGIRPEDFSCVNGGDVPNNRRLDVGIDLQENMGAEIYLHFRVAARPVLTEGRREAVGDDAFDQVGESENTGVRFVARVERGTNVRDGQLVSLCVDTDRLHFFDLETGMSIYESGADGNG